jgi:2-keto-4-pentenoate hydratase/2-oxohepta-3-ene-1,7-dioic acid hydratase in catechol pathway
VTYIDLHEELGTTSTNAFDLLQSKSYDQLSDQLSQLKKQKTANTKDLCFAFEAREKHLCAGLNYNDHVSEIGGENKLVLFPKFGKLATGLEKIPVVKNSGIPELLDFEIELGVLFDRDIFHKDDLQKAHAGFFVANDISDRAPQIFYYGDVENHESYSFAASKSKRGYSVISPILVIPKDWRAFSRDLEMKLSVNGQVRQKSRTSHMSQGIEDMILLALNDPKEKKWPLLKNSESRSLGDSIPLLPQSPAGQPYLQSGMVFMTGTPGGTIFQKPKLMELAKAAWGIPYLGTDAKELSLKQKLKLSLIKNLWQSRKFLQPGDKIESEISQLGTLNFQIAND